jgi:hypothetical protein
MLRGLGPIGVPHTPATRAAATGAVLVLGLTVQVAILASGARAPAQVRDDDVIISPIVITQTFTADVFSRANVAVDGSHHTAWRIGARDVITATHIAGQITPAGRAAFTDVVADSAVITFTADSFALRPDLFLLGPVVITAALQTLQEGTYHQRLAISPVASPGSIVISDTVVAQPAPLAFDVFRRYPALVLTGEPFTVTWRIGAADLAISDTVVVGPPFASGFYRSVDSNQGLCTVGRAGYTCLVSLLSGDPLLITVTAEALQQGPAHLRLGLAGDGVEPVVITTTTVAGVAAAPAELTVPIDIRPGGTPNPINPRSQGSIPVAILSTPVFDAPGQVDQLSLRFGPTGDENSLLRCHPEDVNQDGRFDLLCHFDTQRAAFAEGDVAGIVKGQTLTGRPIRGMDSVRIVPQ